MSSFPTETIVSPEYKIIGRPLYRNIKTNHDQIIATTISEAMEKQLVKNGGEGTSRQRGSADQEEPTRPTYLVFKGARNNFSQVVFSDDEEIARVCTAASRRRNVAKKFADLSIQPVEMKERRSKRIEGKRRINYEESSVSKGGTIRSSDDDYLEDDHGRNPDHEEVSSVYVVPKIDTYHLGGIDGDGHNCCAKCREAISALVQKNSDSLAVIDDLEERLSKQMIQTRRDVEGFTRHLREQVNYLQHMVAQQNVTLDDIYYEMNLQGHQPDVEWEELVVPEDPEPILYRPGEDPLDGPVDDTHWYSDDD